MSLFKKPKKVCFVCGSPGSYVCWDALSPVDRTEYRCVECSVDETDLDKAKAHWMAKLIETVVRNKKAKMATQEVLDG